MSVQHVPCLSGEPSTSRVESRPLHGGVVFTFVAFALADDVDRLDDRREGAARIAARPTHFDRVGRVDGYHLFAWVMGADYSIADISLLGWVRNLIGFYEARELVGFVRFLHVQAWLGRGLARPAVQRGLQVTAA